MTQRLSFLPVIAAALMFYCIMPVQKDILFSAQPSAVSALTSATTTSDPTLTPDATPGNSNNLEVTNSDGTRQKCSDIAEAKNGALIGRIAPCIIYTITEGTVAFSQKMITTFTPLFYSFLVFVVVMFGVRILQGERQIHVQGFAFLLKLTIVTSLFTYIPENTISINGNTVPGIIPSVFGAIQDGVTIATSAIGPDSSSFHCDVTQYGYSSSTTPATTTGTTGTASSATGGTPLIWAEMDCVLGKLYGFTTGTDPTSGQKTTNMLLASSAIGLMSGFFFGGTAGVAVFFALLGVLWTLVMIVLRTTMAILNGYLIVSVMLLIAPLFLPLLLLKITNDYFERWWKAMLGGVLLPIVVASYSVFALLVYDSILFKPDSLLQKLFDLPSIQSAMLAPHKPCDIRVTGDPNFQGQQNSTGTTGTTSTADTSALKTQLDTMYKSNPFLQNFVQPALSAGNDACGLFQAPTFDITQVKGAASNTDFTKKKADFLNIFLNAIELFIMSYLMMEGLKLVEKFITIATGSASTQTALFGKENSVESKLEDGFDSAKAGMTRSFRTSDKDSTSVSGAEFIKRVPGSVNTGVQEFLGGVFRN